MTIFTKPLLQCDFIFDNVDFIPNIMFRLSKLIHKHNISRAVLLQLKYCVIKSCHRQKANCGDRRREKTFNMTFVFITENKHI